MARICPALLLLVALTACDSGVDRTQLEPIPEIDLSVLQASFVDRLRDQSATLDRLLDTAGTTDAELAEAFGEMGRRLHMAELVEPGVACYGNAARLAPQEPLWPYYLAHLHLFAGNWEASAESFEQVLKLTPDDTVTVLHLGDLHFEQGRLDEAEQLFRRAMELDDKSGAALFGMGQVHADRDELQEAVESFEAALAASPEASRTHYHLGVLYTRLGDRETADRHLALQGPGIPRHPDPLMTTMRKTKNALKVEIAGSVAFREGRFDDALTELRTAEVADPKSYDVQLALGTTLATMGELDEAGRHFRNALELAETRQMKSIANLNLGNLLVMSGLHTEAAGHYRQTMELTPDLPEGREARFKLASVLVGLGRHDEARPVYRASFEAGSHEPSAYLDLAGGLADGGRFADARWIYERGRDAHPLDGSIANALVRLLSTCPDDAVRNGAAALELAGSLFGAQRSGPHAVTLAMALAENGRFDEAAELQRNAIADAERQGRQDIADRLRRDLSLYEQKKPLRRP